MISLIGKLSNFSVEEFVDVKKVKDIYYNRDILIDIDSIPEIIIENGLYPTDLVGTSTKKEDIRENPDIKNFNTDVMDTIYALYTDVRLDVLTNPDDLITKKDKIPVYERVL